SGPGRGVGPDGAAPAPPRPDERARRVGQQHAFARALARGAGEGAGAPRRRLPRHGEGVARVPFHDVLLGLRALFLERPAAKGQWGALLQRRSPDLSPAERQTLLAIPEERLDVYVSLVRENQAALLRFVAPTTVEAL